jgi:outer membrane biosynthesis protein TonB
MSSQLGWTHPEPRHPAPNSSRPWYKKKRWIIPIGILVALAVIGQLSDNSEKPSTTAIQTESAATLAPVSSPTTSPTSDPEPTPSVVPATDSQVDVEAVTTVKPKIKPKAVIKVKPKPEPKKTTAKPRPRKTKKPAPSCDPNYSGGCVPIASDVDCAGGSGNGPAYFSGTARVTGDDIYDLDRDGDGIACESS